MGINIGLGPGRGGSRKWSSAVGALALALVIGGAATACGKSTPTPAGSVTPTAASAVHVPSDLPTPSQTPATTATPQAQPTRTQPATEPATQPVTTSAPAAPTHAAAPPVTTVPKAPPSTAAPVSCTPLSDEGTCYEPGEYCRTDDHGTSGIAGDGKAITCEDNDGWRWEPS